MSTSPLTSAEGAPLLGREERVRGHPLKRPRPGDASARRRAGSFAGGPVAAGDAVSRDRRCGSSACACLLRRPLTYLDIADAADMAADELIAELSSAPIAHADGRTAEPLARLWRAVFTSAPELAGTEDDDHAMRPDRDAVAAAGVAAAATEALPVEPAQPPPSPTPPTPKARAGGKGVPPPPPLLTPPPVPSQRWKLLGFQGADPVTDLRAARLPGLLYLVRLVEAYPEAAELGRRSAPGDGMPLAIVALNALYMLRCHLVLLAELPAYCPCCSTRVREEVTTARAQPHGGRHLRGFALLLLDDPDALFHIYAMTVLLLGRAWARRFGPPGGRGHMHDAGHGDTRLLQFPSLLAEARAELLEQLAALPPDVDALRARLLRPQEG